MAVNPNARHRQQGHVSVFAAARKDRVRHQAAQQRRRELFTEASVTLKQKSVVLLTLPASDDWRAQVAFEEKLAAFRAVVKSSNGRYCEDLVNGVYVFGTIRGATYGS